MKSFLFVYYVVNNWLDYIISYFYQVSTYIVPIMFVSNLLFD